MNVTKIFNETPELIDIFLRQDISFPNEKVEEFFLSFPSSNIFWSSNSSSENYNFTKKIIMSLLKSCDNPHTFNLFFKFIEKAILSKNRVKFFNLISDLELEEEFIIVFNNYIKFILSINDSNVLNHEHTKFESLNTGLIIPFLTLFKNDNNKYFLDMYFLFNHSKNIKKEFIVVETLTFNDNMTYEEGLELCKNIHKYNFKDSKVFLIKFLSKYPKAVFHLDRKVISKFTLFLNRLFTEMDSYLTDDLFSKTNIFSDYPYFPFESKNIDDLLVEMLSLVDSFELDNFKKELIKMGIVSLFNSSFPHMTHFSEKLVYSFFDLQCVVYDNLKIQFNNDLFFPILRFKDLKFNDFIFKNGSCSMKDAISLLAMFNRTTLEENKFYIDYIRFFKHEHFDSLFNYILLDVLFICNEEDRDKYIQRGLSHFNLDNFYPNFSLNEIDCFYTFQLLKLKNQKKLLFKEEFSFFIIKDPISKLFSSLKQYMDSENHISTLVCSVLEDNKHLLDGISTKNLCELFTYSWIDDFTFLKIISIFKKDEFLQLCLLYDSSYIVENFIHEDFEDEDFSCFLLDFLRF